MEFSLFLQYDGGGSTAMTARPILFSGEMVRAILDGRKTQTRRPVKPHPEMREIDGTFCGFLGFKKRKGSGYWIWPNAQQEIIKECPWGQPGDLLWVREKFHYARLNEDNSPCILYAVDKGIMRVEQDVEPDENWRPSIHMPRWASRLTLEITGVRVERLQDISEEDAQAEGAPFELGELERLILGAKAKYRSGFCRLWESINGGGSWEANQWVWVIEFKPILMNIDRHLARAK